MNTIYFDNSATTRPAKEAVDAATRFMTEEYGNPSSLHFMGINAFNALSQARSVLAKELGCDASQVYFTSGGTESNNTAVFGAVRKNRHIGKKIVVSAVEHDSIINVCKALEAEGYSVSYVMPDKTGRINPEEFAGCVDSSTAFVSCMLVNNEVGSINDVKRIFELSRKKSPGVICHTDAVQAFGKISVNPVSLGCDMMSISGHKIHAVKGIGALYIKKGLKIPQRNIGGGQEMNMRSGTESMPLIMAFAEAVKLLNQKNEHFKAVCEIRDYVKEQLIKEGVTINSPDDALPYILNVSAEGIRSEVMLNFLSSEGICVSAGSACSKGKRSHVLTAMKMNNRVIDSAVRISFSRYNTKQEADALISAVIKAKSLLLIKR